MGREGVKKKWEGGAIGVLGLILLVFWMQGGLGGKRVHPGRALPPMIAASDLKTLPVRERTDSTVTSWPGTVVAKTKAVLSAQVAARVLQVNVRQGDRVKKGSVLVRLDRQEAEARLKQVEAVKILLDFTAVTAPFDGQVVRKEIDPGEFAAHEAPH